MQAAPHRRFQIRPSLLISLSPYAGRSSSTVSNPTLSPHLPISLCRPLLIDGFKSDPLSSSPYLLMQAAPHRRFQIRPSLLISLSPHTGRSSSTVSNPTLSPHLPISSYRPLLI